MEPHFTRGEVAKILNVTPLTIANREQRGIYPPPRREKNNYRYYTVRDVLNLQLATFDQVDPRPIISVLYDKGYKDTRIVSQIIDCAITGKALSL